MRDAETPRPTPSPADLYSTADANAGPGISLIVPCYTTDRYADLCRLIDSVRSQRPAVAELILVVQKSRELESLLTMRLSDLPTVGARVIFLDSDPAVSPARNAGVDAAACGIIAFADDDAVLADGWTLATHSFYRRFPDAIGAAGAILPLWDSPAMDWFPRELWWMLSCTYWTAATPVPVRNGYGANMSFRREAFDDGRRFDESLGISGWGTGGWRGVGGEEPELALRITAETGRPVMYAPEVRAWHRVRASRLRSGSLLRRAYWEGRFKAILSRYPAGTQRVLHTEWSLLRSLARAHIGRLRLLASRPRDALRQEGAVILVVAAVAFGFLDGKLRRIRAGVFREPSNAREESAV